jgi:hypothetical protein
LWKEEKIGIGKKVGKKVGKRMVRLGSKGKVRIGKDQKYKDQKYTNSTASAKSTHRGGHGCDVRVRRWLVGHQSNLTKGEIDHTESLLSTAGMSYSSARIFSALCSDLT